MRPEYQNASGSEIGAGFYELVKTQYLLFHIIIVFVFQNWWGRLEGKGETENREAIMDVWAELLLTLKWKIGSQHENFLSRYCALHFYR